MRKFKHNKKRNTAFLYESLILEMTKAVLENNKEKQHIAKDILQECFKKESMLLKDLRAYVALVETKGVDKDFATRILNEAKSSKNKIDKKQLFNEQNTLIKKIKDNFSDSFFSNFVPSYKHLASISQIFNTEMSIKSKILLENELIEMMTSEDKKVELLPIDSLAYKIFIDKFNKEYSNKLLPEQKELLEKYIVSFKDNGVDLKFFLNEEVGRLKEEIENISKDKSEDPVLTKQLEKVMEVLNGFSTVSPDESMITKVISTQSLVKEIKENVNQD